MSIGGTVVKTGTKTVKEGMDFLSKQIAELTTTLKPVAKDASDRVIVIGRDLYNQAPSVISKYPGSRSVWLELEVPGPSPGPTWGLRQSPR